MASPFGGGKKSTNFNGNEDESQQDVPSFRYRSKRRNASVGDNIKTFSRHLEEASRKGSSFSMIHRPQSGRIDNRKTRFNNNFNNQHQQNNHKSVRFPNHVPDLRNIIAERNNKDDDLEVKSDSDVRTKTNYNKLYAIRSNKNNMHVNNTNQKRFTRNKTNNNNNNNDDDKPHLSIGESSSTNVSPLITSNTHCKITTMDDGVFQLIIQFLKQYIELYDKNREELLPAYHSKALFSISLNVKSSPMSTSSYKFGSYFKESRNQVHVMNPEKNYQILKQGNLETIAFLSKLPPTEHKLESLKLDSSFFMPNIVTFSATGIFKEGKSDEKIRPYRSFQRVFVCIPTSNEQMVIVNEQYTISQLSADQQKQYNIEASPFLNKSYGNFNKQLRETPVSVTISNDLTSANDMKKSMVEKFSQDTNLTQKWSQDILEFSNWDYSKAIINLREHQNELPSDAFIAQLMPTNPF